MSVIPIEEAMLHLRAEPEDQEDVQKKLDAAEEKAMSFLQRRFYRDEVDLINELTTVKQRIIDVRAEYDAELAQAERIENPEDKQLLKEFAESKFRESRRQIRMIAKGLVINDAIKIACLLTLGDLYENREDSVTGTITADIPVSSRHWLTPYRVDMGV